MVDQDLRGGGIAFKDGTLQSRQRPVFRSESNVDIHRYIASHQPFLSPIKACPFNRYKLV
jgi:hypothetical protein